MPAVQPRRPRSELAAEAAAELVEDGMTVGLGTGSTVAHLLPALAARGLERSAASRPRRRPSSRRASSGIPVEPFDGLERLDIAIDGADQVAPDGWLVKGGGGAHTREKIVAAAAERFVVIADSSQAGRADLRRRSRSSCSRSGSRATLRELGDGRRCATAPRQPRRRRDRRLPRRGRRPAGARRRGSSATPGVVDHGLFPPAMVTDVIVGRGRARSSCAACAQAS